MIADAESILLNLTSLWLFLVWSKSTSPQASGCQAMTAWMIDLAFLKISDLKKPAAMEATSKVLDTLPDLSSQRMLCRIRFSIELANKNGVTSFVFMYYFPSEFRAQNQNKIIPFWKTCDTSKKWTER